MEVRQGLMAGGATPMDIGSLDKGKGKGQGVRFNCGKKGHQSKDCWAPKKVKGNGKGAHGRRQGPG
eukprot:4635635-Heterocapsa_arctica.AAC.1